MKKTNTTPKDCVDVGGCTPIIQLKEEDQKIILELVQEVAVAKNVLTDTSVQALLIEQQRQRAVQQLIGLNNTLVERIKKTAVEYGLDLEHQTWDFDASKMSFSKRA